MARSTSKSAGATPRTAAKTASATQRVTTPLPPDGGSDGRADGGGDGRSDTAPMSALVVQDGEEAWEPSEVAQVLGELHEQREHSLAVLVSQETELTGLMRDAGDGAGHDQADIGATSFERDHELTVVNSERDKLAQIERALARIDDGSYGACESCGGPIGKMRLMAFPRATLCLTCKQREERR